MGAREEWIFRVLGVRVGSGAPDALTVDSLVSSLRERSKEMVADAKLLGDKGALAAVAAAAVDVQKAIAASDLVAAELAADRMEALVAQARSAARVGEAAKAGGRVSYRKAQVQWRQARGNAFAGVRTLTNKVLADERLLDDPDSAALMAVVRGFPDLLPAFDEELEDALDALDALGGDGDPERRKRLVEEARAALADYQALLDDEALVKLQALADDEFGGVDVLHTLGATLRSIEGTLA